MTPEYEFATTDLTQHLYHFAKPNAKFLTVNPQAQAGGPAAAARRRPSPRLPRDRAPPATRPAVRPGSAPPEPAGA